MSTVESADPHDTGMIINRNGGPVYEVATATGQMDTTCENLVSSLNSHNAVRETAVPLTGTALVPVDDPSLTVDGTVHITIEGICTLENIREVCSGTDLMSHICEQVFIRWFHTT